MINLLPILVSEDYTADEDIAMSTEGYRDHVEFDIEHDRFGCDFKMPRAEVVRLSRWLDDYLDKTAAPNG